MENVDDLISVTVSGSREGVTRFFKEMIPWAIAEGLARALKIPQDGGVVACGLRDAAPKQQGE